MSQISAKKTPESHHSIRLAAMDLLAMREHSCVELREKLARKFTQQAWIDAVLAELAEEGLQCDARFADAFTAMRYRQGKGPLVVAMELKARGVSSDLVDASVKHSGYDWAESAVKQRQKRFGASLPVDAKERARQLRFLQSRGFGSAHACAALSPAPAGTYS